MIPVAGLPCVTPMHRSPRVYKSGMWSAHQSCWMPFLGVLVPRRYKAACFTRGGNFYPKLGRGNISQTGVVRPRYAYGQLSAAWPMAEPWAGGRDQSSAE